MNEFKENEEKRMRNPDGTFTSYGAKHYGREGGKASKRLSKDDQNQQQIESDDIAESSYNEQVSSARENSAPRENIYDNLRRYSES